MHENAEAFHQILDAALATLPQMTSLGRVVGTDTLHFGAPSGSHREATFWRFERGGSPHVLHFGFVPNFTPHDLMCKVSLAGEMPSDGAGASIQFNGSESFRAVAGGGIGIQHHGRVTVTHAISRADLVARMTEVAPEVVGHFGGIDERRFPLALGTTSDLPSLVDSLLVWCFGVEQVKRSLREQPLLPPLHLG
jgi:hypothetical protein